MNPEIVELAEARVARFHALSSSPEEEAWTRLRVWADPKGLLEDGAPTRIFGFNNPDPSAASPNYGYEFWIAVDHLEEGDLAGVETVIWTGGRYATVPFESDDLHQLGDAWKELVQWAEGSGYARGTHRRVEGINLRGMPVRIYLPIAG